MVERVGNDDGPRWPGGDLGGSLESRETDRTVVVADGIVQAETGQSRDDAGRGDLADGVVLCVCAVDVAGSISRQAAERPKPRRGADAVGGAGCADAARQSSDDTGGSDFAQSVVPLIGDVDIAGRVDRDSGWIIESGGTPGSVCTLPHPGLTGDGGDNPVRSDLANRAVA